MRKYKLVEEEVEACGRSSCTFSCCADVLKEDDDGYYADFDDVCDVICELVDGLELAMTHVQSAEVRAVLQSLIQKAAEEVR